MPKIKIPNDFTPTQFGMFPEGDFHFVVDECEETTSHAGNAMLKMVLAVDAGGDKPRKVYYYLTFANEEWSYRWLEGFTSSVGLPYKDDSGNVSIEANECLGKIGMGHFIPQSTVEAEKESKYGKVHYFISQEKAKNTTLTVPKGSSTPF